MTRKFTAENVYDATIDLFDIATSYIPLLQLKM